MSPLELIRRMLLGPERHRATGRREFLRNLAIGAVSTKTIFNALGEDAALCRVIDPELYRCAITPNMKTYTLRSVTWTVDFDAIIHEIYKIRRSPEKLRQQAANPLPPPWLG